MVRLAPNNLKEESAAISFNTGIPQGIITSPQPFKISINALLRTVRGQIENISHGQQIGKDLTGNNLRHENSYRFNKIGFIDNISIFADTPEGMQKLLNVVQEFTAGVECKSKYMVWNENQYNENVIVGYRL